MSKSEQQRPDGLSRQAAWPPRVPFESTPTTYHDGSIVVGDVPPSGGVRIGRTAMSGDITREHLAEMPTDGPGVARRAIPAPESAGTTGTIPPPHVMASDAHSRESVAVAAPEAADDDAPVSRSSKGKAKK